MSERSSYSLEKAYEEAANMQDKIKSGKAENYTEAEILVDNEKEKLSQKEKDFSQCFLQIEIKLKPEEEKEEIITFSQEEIEKLAQEQFLLDYNSQTLLAIIPERFKRNAENFEITLGEWKKAALIRPQLLIQKPETLEANIIESANRFNVSKESFVKAALDKPQLFYQKPETLEANIIESARRFNVSKEVFGEAALKQPQLFCQKPETLEANIIESARKLEIDKEVFIGMSLNNPVLFSSSPQTLKNKFDLKSRLLFLDDDETRKRIVARPNSLNYSPERDILHYLAKKITGKEKINFSKSPIEIISDYFLEREDAESAQQWQRAARYFDALSKKKRKTIRRNIKRKEKEGIQPGYTETDLYRNLIVFSEEYFGEKSDSLTDAEIQKIQELVDKVVRHLEEKEKKEINLASRP